MTRTVFNESAVNKGGSTHISCYRSEAYFVFGVNFQETYVYSSKCERENKKKEDAI